MLMCNIAKYIIGKKMMPPFKGKLWQVHEFELICVLVIHALFWFQNALTILLFGLCNLTFNELNLKTHFMS
jgi:hypothetical protein